ncbi:MAG: hypothetical protein ACXQTZ_00705 [Candidatus Alkanophagales archaeon]
MKAPKLKLRIEVYDRNRRLLKVHEQEARSWLQNFYSLMSMLMYISTTTKVIDTTGSGRDISGAAGSYTWDYEANTMIGIGSSDEAFDVKQYKLGNEIATSYVDSSTYDIDKKQVVFSAEFSFSAAATIRETGIMYENVRDSAGNLFNMYIERTVLDTPISVDAGQILRIFYTLQY